ncbi:hypothetical protein KHQ88_06605 [Mycoplasmatota bacterium]|nr:hypothetical protein KHQ88_06605 [Mycoplasmatota bacterium]
MYYGNHNGYNGWVDHASFDKIIVAAASRYIPNHLIQQLSKNGKMMIPMGPEFYQRLYLIKKENHHVEKIKLQPVRFVPMIKK